MRQILALAALAGLLTAGSPALASAGRSFVSTGGSDANTSANCAPTAPCRTFTAALSVTTSGGEVVVLDSGGYGPFTVTQSVIITAPDGVYAGISVASGSGVTVNGTGITVTLHGLTINGTGGTAGITFTAGLGLNVENTTIANFSASGSYGILATPAALVKVVDSIIRDCYTGIEVDNGPQLSVVDTRFLGTIEGGVRSMNTGVLLLEDAATLVTVPSATIVGCEANEGVENAFVANAIQGAVLTVDRSIMVGGGTGVSVNMLTGSGTLIASISNSVFSKLGTGVVVTGGIPSVFMNHNTLTGNATGVHSTVTAQLVGLLYAAGLYSFGNNSFAGNGTDGSMAAAPSQNVLF